ncbi:hypothetical protein ASE23_28630 [Rhizobium sp. Root73]|nr:hypothetical protein ASD36_28575 [Rhizobium sp. Root1334]KRC03950.1 hypothetical protein ASE23_28630 [Rhizobium sp. Root73]
MRVWDGALITLPGITYFSPAFACDSPDKAIAPVDPVSPFFLFQDMSISYWHEFNAAEPGIGTGIQKDIISLTHFDAWIHWPS